MGSCDWPRRGQLAFTINATIRPVLPLKQSPRLPGQHRYSLSLLRAFWKFIHSHTQLLSSASLPAFCVAHIQVPYPPRPSHVPPRQSSPTSTLPRDVRHNTFADPRLPLLPTVSFHTQNISEHSVDKATTRSITIGVSCTT